MAEEKKILIVDESPLFREYLESRFTRYGFNVVHGANGLDGSLKLRQELPDLLIMEYFLTRKSSIEILREKMGNPNTAPIPTIMISSKLDKNRVMEIASLDVKKVVSKPVQLSALLASISEVLGMPLEIDNSPCVIEAHFNDEIIFIELARGLNEEKIDLLRFKLRELLSLYSVEVPKVLIMMSDIELTQDDDVKFDYLLQTVMNSSGVSGQNLKFLTKLPYVSEFMTRAPGYNNIEAVDSLEQAMDELLGVKPDEVAHDEVMRERLLSTSAPSEGKEETFLMRFDAEAELAKAETEAGEKKSLTIGVVDDDMVIRELVKTVFIEAGFAVQTFENGKEFLDALGGKQFDLVFLDLMMPVMDGFQVLETIRDQGISVPIIVFSALSRKETVVKAVGYGITSYMIKPLKPERLFRKAAEVLQTNF